MRWLAISPCIALLVVCAVCGQPTLAHGDGAGVIASDGPARSAAAAALVDAIGDRARRVVADALAEARAAHASGAVAIEQLRRFRRVRDQTDEGWRAYQRVASEFALQRLTSARNEAEPLLALPGGGEIYADTALRLGVVLAHVGRKDEATAVLRLALALDRERPITLAEFSPDVIEVIEAARASQPARHRVTITSAPASAQLTVDGASVGKAPLELELEAGQHTVVARLAGRDSAVRAFAVSEPTKLELALADDPIASALAGDAGEQLLVDHTLRLADLDEVVLVSELARRGGRALVVQRCAGEPARCSAVVDIGYPTGGLAAAARAAWQAVRTGELRYPPTVLGERSDQIVVRPRCTLCRNPWLWTGVGAALVTGAIVAIIVTSGSRPPPVVGVDPGDFLPP